MEENQQQFEYTYAAVTENERKEIEDIRKSYVEKEEMPVDKLTRLKKLDEKVKNPPMILGLSLGIIGTLIFGLGLAMILEWDLLLFGSVVSVLGFIPVALAYFCYSKLLERNKLKYKDEILRLSEELLNERE